MRAHVIVLGILALWGCGGGGGEAPPIDDVSVGGIWEGAVDIQGQGVVGLIAFTTEAGAAHFIQDDGVQYWGTVASSQRDLTGTISAATALGKTFADGATGASGAISGTIIPYGKIEATLSLTTSSGAPVSGQILLNFEPTYRSGSPLENISGTYTSLSAPGVDSFTLDSNGVLFGQNPETSCVINGQIRRITPFFNSYGIRVTYGNCAGDYSVLNGATLSGLGALNFDNPALRFIGGLGGTASGVPVAILFAYERT